MGMRSSGTSQQIRMTIASETDGHRRKNKTRGSQTARQDREKEREREREREGARDCERQKERER